MGSVGFGELALIAIVVLLVFGPDRLPELSRKAGALMTKAREATRSFTDAIDSEFEETTAPLRTLQSDFKATKDELSNAAGTILNFDASPSKEPATSNETPEDDATTEDQPGDVEASE